MSLLVICEMLVLFGNTLTTDGKYSLRKSELLLQPIQMQLSKKQITFDNFSAPFPKSTLNYKHFEEKDDPHSLYISEISESERHG